MNSKNWKEIESTKKAVLWETSVDGRNMFVVSIGNNKKLPSEGVGFRRDAEGKLVVKGSYWRYPYQENNRKEILHWATLLYSKHC